MNVITGKIKVLNTLRELTEKTETTKDILLSVIDDMRDELENELLFLSDCLTIDRFFNSVVSFIDYENTTQTSDEIERITGDKLQSDNWLEYYNNKKYELTQWEFTTRIVLTDNSGWTCDIIYTTTKAKAIEILLDNYNGYDGDSVEIQHYNGDEWEVVGEYIWRE